MEAMGIGQSGLNAVKVVEVERLKEQGNVTILNQKPEEKTALYLGLKQNLRVAM